MPLSYAIDTLHFRCCHCFLFADIVSLYRCHFHFHIIIFFRRRHAHLFAAMLAHIIIFAALMLLLLIYAARCYYAVIFTKIIFRFAILRH